MSDTVHTVHTVHTSDTAPTAPSGPDAPSVRSIARCSDGEGTFAPLFFSDDDFDLARARAMCRRCGLRAACLDGALERGEAYGVWGGELLVDGVIAEIVPRRGRPPKVAWRDLVVDEVPPPPHRVA